MVLSQAAFLCDAEKSVLTVIDIQTGLTAVMPAKVLARLQRCTSLLINAAKTLSIPIYTTEQYPKGLGKLEPEIMNLLADGDGIKRYEKTSFSCVGANNFSEDLAASGRKQIILTGMETHVCILQSAIDLLNLEYQVIIISDAVCSRHRESYETAMIRLNQAGAIITNTESVIFEWLRDSKHEHFKSLQTLVR